jgi:hypothetical protein
MTLSDLIAFAMVWLGGAVCGASLLLVFMSRSSR